MLTGDNASKFSERILLWKELIALFESQPKQKFSAEEINKRRVLQMVVDGRLSAACASLISEALSEPNEENLRKLLEKHPLQDIPLDIPSPCDTQQVYVDSDLVLKKLRSFPRALPLVPLVLVHPIYCMPFK